MPPPQALISSQLRQLIFYHLDNGLNSNALFLAERLVANDRTADAVHLLALAHIRLGDNRSAQEYSKPFAIRGFGGHLGCAYIFAQASLALETYRDGITALEKCRPMWSGRSTISKHSPSRRDHFPDAAAVHCLLGKLYRAYEDTREATRHFEEALKLNPFMWDAFTALCDMGVSIKVPNVFKMNPDLEDFVRSGPEENTYTRMGKDSALVPLGGESYHNKSGIRSAPTSADNTDPFNNIPTSRGHSSTLFNPLAHKNLNESNPPQANGLGVAAHPAAVSSVTQTPDASNAMDQTVDQWTSVRRPTVATSYPLEAPHAPLRRRVDLIGPEAVEMPKTSRGLSVKRPTGYIPTTEMTDDPLELGRKGAAPGVTERKRTASGMPRSGSEDPTAQGAQRRSARLFSQMRPGKSTNITSTTAGSTREVREVKKSRPQLTKIMRPGGTSTVGRIVSGNRDHSKDVAVIDQKEGRYNPVSHTTITRTQSAPNVDLHRNDTEAMMWLLDLLKKLGHGYFNLSQFQTDAAIQIFNTVPQAQFNTPWVLLQLGRSYYEQALYSEAEQVYKRVRNMAPTRFEGMEVYSTVLWHLKREADLSFLAHELIDADWHASQAWCALGNAWSLTREHETALKCFKRAIQLDPKSAYSHTLQGHEHMANEEYDKAMGAYRHAMAVDKRHYNAYYGIGKVLEKMGQYDKAFSHYTAAAQINPTNAVLICCQGTIHEKLKQPKKALRYFNKATEIAPKSALTRFKKARCLMAMNELNAAKDQLMILKDLAPDEAMVHFLLGRLYKSLREKGMAVKHFTIALNLDPKASAQIKEAIESLEMEADEVLDHDGDSMIV